MQVLQYILLGILLLSAAFLIFAVLLQKSQEDGLSGAIAGSSQTFFGKDGGDRKERSLKKWTMIVGVIFAVAVLLVYIIQPDYSETLPVGEWKKISSYSSLFG